MCDLYRLGFLSECLSSSHLGLPWLLTVVAGLTGPRVSASRSSPAANCSKSVGGQRGDVGGSEGSREGRRLLDSIERKIIEFIYIIEIELKRRQMKLKAEGQTNGAESCQANEAKSSLGVERPRLLLFVLYLLSRYMWPEGPWQRQSCCPYGQQPFSRPLLHDQVSYPRLLRVIPGHPNLLLPINRQIKEREE